MAKKYKVNCLGIFAGKKKFKYGEEVTESQFDKDVFNSYISSKKLVEVTAESKQEKEVPKVEKSDKALFTYKDEAGNDVEVFEEGDINLKKIKALLTEKGIEFDNNGPKSELFKKLVEVTAVS